MGFARSRSLTVSADGASNYTAPCSCRKGGVVTISGTLTGDITLQRRGADNVWRDVTNNSGVVTTFTLVGTYTIGPNEVQADYRLNAKQGAVSAFPFTMTIEGK